MANIGDILARLFGGVQDPREAILANSVGAQQPAPQQPAPQQPAQQQGIPVPPSPLVQPAAAPYPQSMQSPPDLANMYLKMMEKTRNAERLDEAFTTIAAGFAHPENRQALLATIGRGGGSNVGMDDIIRLQQMQREQQLLSQQQQQLPALAQTYGLDPATVQYLQASGQLPDVIKQLASPDTEVVQRADGSKILINKRDGSTVRSLSNAAPRPTEYQELPDGSKTLVYTDDKTEVGSGKQLTEIGAAPITEIVKAADGSNVLVDKRSGQQLGVITPAAEPGTLVLDRADGSKALINEKDGKVIRELSPGTNLNAEEEAMLATINRERAAAGQPPLTMEEYLKTAGKRGITVENNIGPSGVDYGAPPKGMAWKRDADGKVVVNDEGAPTPVWIKESPEYLDYQEKQQKLQAAAREQETEAGKETIKTKEEATSGLIFTEDTNRAINVIQQNRDSFIPAHGFGSWLSGIPTTPQNTLAGALRTIKTSIGFKKLQAMRNASPTGGALGTISDFENRMLQASEGSLDQSGDPDELIYNLRRTDRLAKLVVEGIVDPATGERRAIQTQEEVEAAMADIPKPPSLGGLPADDIGGYKVEKIEE